MMLKTESPKSAEKNPQRGDCRVNMGSTKDQYITGPTQRQ